MEILSHWCLKMYFVLKFPSLYQPSPIQIVANKLMNVGAFQIIHINDYVPFIVFPLLHLVPHLLS